ncbi:alternative ribosome rescue aminoacyl-tRNA hydrolase ArfB [Microvirga flavescens]|uniref:alternative ribosome rescue aminoacyl-tRNA hydrolase ArfB n=1 Tax=Microvirga flavescens TaxID=2249811 RepID=UPI000DDA0765|nr:alternative ribosome rescue aminoacyl-tRNA hydrolase ArfB [Microvirga flavescens]
MIEVNSFISLDESEIQESFIRSSGPGGQNVNKVSSAVQLRFDARGSPSLPNDVAIRLMKLAGSKLTQEGVIVIVAQSHRSQQRNREEALERLLDLIRSACITQKKRRPTKPTKASKERRLESKGKRSVVKATRRAKPMAD